jgi:hypothetical protein
VREGVRAAREVKKCLQELVWKNLQELEEERDVRPRR